MNVYLYLLDTLADWEIGYITAELYSGRFFKKDAPALSLKTVSDGCAPVRTMGGLAVTPDCRVEEVAVHASSVLLLPGANTWGDPRQGAILKKAAALLGAGGTVCAICGATTALANAGLLDAHPHTSNGPGFLEQFAPGYRGQAFYCNQPCVADGNLITAGCTGSLLWAKQILARLGVFEPDTLMHWYAYFSTGKPEAFYALLQTLPAANSAQG